MPNISWETIIKQNTNFKQIYLCTISTDALGKSYLFLLENIFPGFIYDFCCINIFKSNLSQVLYLISVREVPMA